ncbi:MAG: efflux RND transporter periplasmic adaptor subunit, partial [Verrucomicrobiae bacterium]|nr:efflux RND transporter periplasmic adaptor subunit [Verrucomicrobiae bacterium]
LIGAPVGAQESVRVSTVTPVREDITLTTSQPATIHAYFEADLASRVGGYVKAVKVDIGDSVAAGEVLAEIDAPELGIQAERKEAEIRLLTSRKHQLEASVRASQALVRAQKMEFDRVQSLVKTGAVTEKVRDESQSRHESAEASLAVSEAEAKSAEAQIDVAEKELEELQTMIGYASLRAPFAGVVTLREIDPGDLVRVDDRGESLLRVARIDKVRVRVRVPETEAVRVDAGDGAEFASRALRERRFPGKVARSARSIDAGSGTMTVEFDLDNPDGALLPGMFGEATIVLERHEGALVLPSRAVRFDESGDTARVIVVENGAARHVPVRVGLDLGDRMEIAEGLTGAESVVAGVVGGLADGQPVEVTPAP